MEMFLNRIHYIAETVIQHGMNMGGGVWKGVGATVERSGVQNGLTNLTTLRVISHCWTATILVKQIPSGDETIEPIESLGVTKERLEEAIAREDMLRTIQPKQGTIK